MTPPYVHFDHTSIRTVSPADTLAIRACVSYAPSSTLRILFTDPCLASPSVAVEFSVTGDMQEFAVPVDITAKCLEIRGACDAGEVYVESTVLSMRGCDFNGDGYQTSQDFFDYLSQFFTQGPRADFNSDGVVNSQDFNDFLGCQNNGKWNI